MTDIVESFTKCDTAGRVRHHANAESVLGVLRSIHCNTLAAAWLALSISDEAVHCKK